MMRSLPAFAEDGPARLRFLQMLAVHLERSNLPHRAPYVWHAFRRCAVATGHMVAGSPEDGALCGHVARQLASLSGDRRDEVGGDSKRLVLGMPVVDAVFARERTVGDELSKADLLDAGVWYRLAVKGQPLAETFAAWMAWQERWHDKPAALEKAVGEIGRAWAAALPEDPHAHLALCRSATAAFRRVAGAGGWFSRRRPGYMAEKGLARLVSRPGQRRALLGLAAGTVGGDLDRGQNGTFWAREMTPGAPTLLRRKLNSSVMILRVPSGRPDHCNG